MVLVFELYLSRACIDDVFIIAFCYVLYIYDEWIFPSQSIGRVHFQLEGCWVTLFIFIQICKQTVEIMIRRHVMWRLIWV